MTLRQTMNTNPASIIERTHSLQLLILAILSAGLVSLVMSARNDNTLSDPKLTLLVSQALVDHGTIALDAYQDDVILGQSFQSYVAVGDIVQTVDGAFHHYFPIGPSLVAVPFVALARLQGFDMRTADNADLQRWLAAGSLILLLWVLVEIGRTYTSFLTSTLIATVSILSSTLISTLATAFWSHNVTIVCLALALLIVVRRFEQPVSRSQEQEVRSKETISRKTNFDSPLSALHSSLLLAFLLFIAFISRASAAALIAPLLLYLTWRDWRFGIITGAIAGLLLLGFLYTSQIAYGNYLPPYYSTARLTVERAPTWIGIVGNLISPSRGIFIFSSFWLLPLLGMCVFWTKLAHKGLISVLLTWFSLHLWLVARAAKWWGGWSYGPRLMTDLALAFILLTFIIWHSLDAKALLSSRWAASSRVLFLFLTLPSLYINTEQGLFNQEAMRWYQVILPTSSDDPQHPLGDLFRWEYAQFRATSLSNCQLAAEKSAGFLASNHPLGTLQLGTWSGFRDADILDYRVALEEEEYRAVPYFAGWSTEEPNFRWSACPEARILFELGTLPPDDDYFTLTLRIYAVQPQTVSIFFNGEEMQTVHWDDDTPTFGEVFLLFKRADFYENGRNELTFVFPDVQPASDTDQRLLGIGFAGLKLEANETME